MLNWINISFEGDEAVIKDLWDSLEKTLPATDTLTLRMSDGKSTLFVESLAADDIIEQANAVSAKYPYEPIGVRYCASIPGSYRVITATLLAGVLENVAEERDMFLE